MNHTAILKAFVTRISSVDLMTLSRVAAQAEQAGMNGGTSAQIAADQDTILAIDEILKKISDRDRARISHIIEQQVGDPEDKFQRFKTTRKLYNLHELVEQGNESAASFMELNCAPSSTQVYAYNDSDGNTSLFIALTDNHNVALILGNTRDEVHISNIERLERRLFEWAASEGHLD